MDIKHSKPRAGEPIEISVRVDNKWASLMVILDGEKLLHRRFDCPDPPCHEKVAIVLAPEVKGKTIQIHGEDPAGPRKIEITVG